VLSFFSSRRNWASPNPSPAGEWALSPRFWGKGHTRWRERGWESPNSDEGTYTVVLFIYTCFVVGSIDQAPLRPCQDTPNKQEKWQRIYHTIGINKNLFWIVQLLYIIDMCRGVHLLRAYFRARLHIAMAASHNGICIIQQMCHIMILFHDCSIIKDYSNKKSSFRHFLNNIGFLNKGKLVSTNYPLCDAAVAAVATPILRETHTLILLQKKLRYK
jgi:hypothetical protein